VPTSAELQKASSFAWVIANNIINENGQPLEFEDHFFMIDPFNDDHPDIVVKKSAQIGWSVTEIVKAIHDCAAFGVNIIHTLPTQNVIKDFVIPKVNPIVYKNACIKELLANDSVSLKKFGDNFIYYRGSFVEREAISITADILINDEYDRSDQRILAIYQSRLQYSKYKWIRRFSNPSIKGFGVDELYESSD
jgi:phage terminase large subunit GpA-like protein